MPAAFAVEVIAADAVKRGFTAFGLKARVVATVVVDPQPEEEGCEAAAVNDGTGREVEHGKKRNENRDKKKSRVMRRLK